jgi:hypothetical protein
MSAWLKENANVQVTGGLYEGSTGVVVRATPQKVKIRLASGRETGLISKDSVARMVGSSKSQQAPKPTVAVTPKAARKSVRSPAASPKTPPFTLNTRPPSGAPSESERKHSEAIVEAYEEPFMLIDPSILFGLGLFVLDMAHSDMTTFRIPAPENVLAVVLFFAARVFSAPPRSPMNDLDWMTVNWFLVVGAINFYEGLVFARTLNVPGIVKGAVAVPDFTNLSTDVKTDLVNAAICFGVATSCVYTYVCMIQARKEREVSKLLTSTAVIGRMGCIVSRATRSTIIVAMFAMVADYFPAPDTQMAVIVALAMVPFMVSALVIMSSYAAIAQRF